MSNKLILIAIAEFYISGWSVKKGDVVISELSDLSKLLQPVNLNSDLVDLDDLALRIGLALKPKQTRKEKIITITTYVNSCTPIEKSQADSTNPEPSSQYIKLEKVAEAEKKEAAAAENELHKAASTLPEQIHQQEKQKKGGGKA